MDDVTRDTSVQRAGRAQPRNMVWIPGGTFRMVSDRYYTEEAPARRVRVDGFPADRVPVTNRLFTSHVGFRCIVREPQRANEPSS